MGLISSVGCEGASKEMRAIFVQLFAASSLLLWHYCKGSTFRRTHYFLPSARVGKYSEEEARAVIIQILNVVSFCHLQDIVHRDLKPEEDALKLISKLRKAVRCKACYKLNGGPFPP
ncbi:hypothetical protein MRB53_030866 [Persea americana]|uniref:Uncharacterized protein n=1 Tax=Persea americana TaxID=3435 RepID=A0ACC2KNG7_PERAE|nr:hypothetical protein MRB53_030866 [Persea americana]